MHHDRHLPRITAMAGALRCVSRDAILGAGIDVSVVDSLVGRAFLTPVFAGVYVVGLPTLTHRELLRAAVLHAGPRAWPSGRSGLELRGLLPVKAGLVAVTTKRPNVRSPARAQVPLREGGGLGRVTVRRRSKLLPIATEVVDGFQTPPLEPTLVDAAPGLTAWELRRVWREAEYQCVLDPDALRAEIRAHPRPGVRQIRALLEQHYPLTRPGMDVRSRSGELLFLELVREAGLPEPEVNAILVLDGVAYRVDFLWREIGLVVEVDGPLHLVGSHPETDRIQDVDAFVHGIDVLRFPTARLASHRAWAIDRLAAAHARQARRAA